MWDGELNPNFTHFLPVPGSRSTPTPLNLAGVY